MIVSPHICAMARHNTTRNAHANTVPNSYAPRVDFQVFVRVG